jgi:LPXTG-motif cell wall-anchored protein
MAFQKLKKSKVISAILGIISALVVIGLFFYKKKKSNKGK